MNKNKFLTLLIKQKGKTTTQTTKAFAPKTGLVLNPRSQPTNKPNTSNNFFVFLLLLVINFLINNHEKYFFI
jgi:hypothetical protein